MAGSSDLREGFGMIWSFLKLDREAMGAADVRINHTKALYDDDDGLLLPPVREVGEGCFLCLDF